MIQSIISILTLISATMHHVHLTLALPTGASQAREGTFPTIETLLRPGFFREAMRSLQIALFIIYLAHLTLSEKMTLSEDF